MPSHSPSSSSLSSDAQQESRRIVPWTETFQVRSYEVSPDGHVSIQSFCNFLQEIAANHAAVLGFSVEHLTPHSLTWVLSRLHVQVRQYPTWRQTVKVETWPSGENGLYATREFLIYDEADTLIGRATSAWLLIHTVRRRPVRIPEFIKEIGLPDRPRALDDPFDRLPQAERADFERRYQVRYSDLDMNRHVNNVRYVEWAVESLPFDFVTTHRLADLEIQFRAETDFDDKIITQAERIAPGPPGAFLHRLTSEKDNRLVGLARSRWSKEIF